MKRTIVLYFSYIIFLIFQQSPVKGSFPDSIDSLKQSLDTVSNVKTGIDLNYEIAEYYYSRDLDSSLKYINTFMGLVQSIDDTSDIAYAHNFIGYIYDQKGLLEQAARSFKNALELYLLLDDSISIASAYTSLAYIISYGENQTGGIRYLLKSQEIAEAIGDTALLSVTNGNIGYFYERLKDYSTALEYYERSLAFDLQSGDSLSISMSYANLSHVYLHFKDTLKSVNYLAISKSYRGKAYSDYDLAYLYTTYIDTYLELESVDSTEQYIALVEPVIQDNDFLLIEAYVYRQKGQLSSLRGDYRTGLREFDRSIEIYEQIGGSEALPELYRNKAAAYSKLEMYEDAYEAQLLGDDIYDRLNYGAVTGILSNYEQARRSEIELESTRLKYALERQKLNTERLRTQNNLKIAFISISLLLALVSVIIYFMLRLGRKNRDLELQNEMIRESQVMLQKNMEKVKQNEEELRKLNATKDRFFSIIAHDLKNPLSSIVGVSDLYLNNEMSLSEQDMKPLMESMNSTANYGFNLLENLLEWALSNTGEMVATPRQTNLEKVIDRQLEGLTEIAANKGIKVILNKGEEKEVFVDENMLSTILRNLIHNAIKFSHQDGEIVISYDRREDEMLISIEDRGVGIDEDILGQLFNHENRTSRFGTGNEKGSGLGLLLCKDFVEKNSGRIWVESKVNVGTIFRFSLPVTGVRVASPVNT